LGQKYSCDHRSAAKDLPHEGHFSFDSLITVVANTHTIAMQAEIIGKMIFAETLENIGHNMANTPARINNTTQIRAYFIFSILSSESINNQATEPFSTIHNPMLICSR